jgi:hypothetical protein
MHASRDDVVVERCSGWAVDEVRGGRMSCAVREAWKPVRRQGECRRGKTGAEQHDSRA